MAKRYKEICLTESDLNKRGLCVKNNMLKSIEINLTAHFSNSVGLCMIFENCTLFAKYSLDELLPEILKVIIEILKLEKEDGANLSNIKNIPIRLVFEGDGDWGSKAVGFGNFMSDEFVLVEDLIKFAKTKLVHKFSALPITFKPNNEERAVKVYKEDGTCEVKNVKVMTLNSEDFYKPFDGLGKESKNNLKGD